jgi:FAD synthase
MRYTKAMRIQLSASDQWVSGPALAVIGTWDPLLTAHKQLFEKLVRRGTNTGLVPVVIILFPSPARLLNPDPDICLEYTDLSARVALIRKCAEVKVVTVRMSTQDLNASTLSFFDLLESHIHLSELWLGANQSLGRCKQGSAAAIAALTRKRKILLRRLEVSKASKAGASALRSLGEGKIREAIQYVGSAPTWHRPRSGVLKLRWPIGNYSAVPVLQPSLTPVFGPDPISVEIVRASRGGILKWPAREVEWLSFSAGPADPSQVTQ